jgi:hypothetical protein
MTGLAGLRFGAGVSLEQLILRHALGLGLDDLARESTASGWRMMLPIPAGQHARSRGQVQARAVEDIGGLEITIARAARWCRFPTATATWGSCSRASVGTRPADLHLRVGPSAVAGRVAGALAARRQLSRFAD